MDLNSYHINYGLLTSFVSQKLQDENFYPLGITININNSEISIRSRINEHLKIYKSEINRLVRDNMGLKNLISSGYCSEKLLSEIVSQKIFPFYNLLEDEKQVIKKIFELKGSVYLNTLSKDMLENDFEKYIMEISDVFDSQIKIKYIGELQRLFLFSIDKEEEKELFRITNFLIHFINWENSFYNFYDNSLEIISGVIRKAENYIDPELLTAIKSYRAYHSCINVLTRFLEKREKGRISTLSLLDWHSDIKMLLTKQFTSFFGKIKATEYIDSLERILTEKISG